MSVSNSEEYKCPLCNIESYYTKWDSFTLDDFTRRSGISGGTIIPIKDAFNNTYHDTSHTCPKCDRVSTIRDIRVFNRLFPEPIQEEKINLEF